MHARSPITIGMQALHTVLDTDLACHAGEMKRRARSGQVVRIIDMTFKGADLYLTTECPESVREIVEQEPPRLPVPSYKAAATARRPRDDVAVMFTPTELSQVTGTTIRTAMKWIRQARERLAAANGAA